MGYVACVHMLLTYISLQTHQCQLRLSLFSVTHTVQAVYIVLESETFDVCVTGSF